MKIYFLRHFKTLIDENIPVEEWGWDDQGKKDMQNLLNSDIFKDVSKIFTSPQKKARKAAIAIGDKYKIPVLPYLKISEVDRSKSPFIPGDYEKVVESYFKDENFVYNWENIRDVKERINDFLELMTKQNGDCLVISHGLFLSLLLHKYFNKDVMDFWKDLGFGQVLEVDFEKLKTLLGENLYKRKR